MVGFPILQHYIKENDEKSIAYYESSHFGNTSEPRAQMNSLPNGLQRYTESFPASQVLIKGINGQD